MQTGIQKPIIHKVHNDKVNVKVVQCPNCHKLILLEDCMSGFWCPSCNPKLTWIDAVKNSVSVKRINYLLGAYKREISKVDGFFHEEKTGILADIKDLSNKAGISLREGLLRSRFRGVLSLMDLKQKRRVEVVPV